MSHKDIHGNISRLKKPVIAAGGVAASFFSATAWLLSTDETTLLPIKNFLEQHFLFFQVAVPAFSGLFTLTLALLYIVIWNSPNNSNEAPRDNSSKKFPLQKIEKLRWATLSTEDKREFFQTFIKLNPKATSVVTVAAPLDKQSLLQEASPVDDTHINRINDLLQLEYAPFRLPFTPEEFDRYNDFRKAVLNNLSSRTLIRITTKMRHLLDAIYKYLACPELRPTSEQRRHIDCVIVAAARWSLRQRVDEAIRQAKLSSCHIILTGSRPSYDDSDQPPIAESEVMHYYMENRGADISPDRMHLETTSRSSREAIVNSLRYLTELRKARKRSLVVGLVTSSFHMRRFYLQTERTYSDVPHIVSQLMCLTVPASYDFADLIQAEELSGRPLVVLQTSISEYLKLIGARAIGEI